VIVNIFVLAIVEKLDVIVNVENITLINKSRKIKIKNMEKETLWLPDGYGTGTIIYDKENNPYKAKEKAISGANIFFITPVEKEYAEKIVKQGRKVLISK
jgi:hypothetical protein